MSEPFGHISVTHRFAIRVRQEIVGLINKIFLNSTKNSTLQNMAGIFFFRQLAILEQSVCFLLVSSYVKLYVDEFCLFS